MTEERIEKSGERQGSMLILPGAGFSIHGSRFTGHSSPFPLHPSRRCAGFTMLEILTVIAIIGILAGLTLGVRGYVTRKAMISRAKAEIATMETALESFKADNGTYPITPVPPFRPVTAGPPNYANSPRLYIALAGGPGYPKTYMTFRPDQLYVPPLTTITNIIDPYGQPYAYYCTQPLQSDQTNSVTFDLWSYGSDGKNDTADDIVNWRQ